MAVNRQLPEFITQNTGTEIIGKRMLLFRSVTSTNDIAKLEAADRTVEGTVIIARQQTAGRGRAQRTWIAPEGSLNVSIILYPDMSKLPYLIMAASLAVVNTIKKVTGIEADIKWPNDVQINGKKVCGILIENNIKGDRVEYTVVGIGVNVNINIKNNQDITNPATSLSAITGKEVPIADFTQTLLSEMEKQYLAGKEIFQEWQHKLITLGKEVRAISGKHTIEGKAESVETDGSIIVRTLNGETVRFTAGDVTIRNQDPEDNN